MSGHETWVVTLGALSVTPLPDSDRTALVRRRKPFALLVYLLLGKPGGDFHQRESLCALLWPESSSRKARASLRQAIAVIERHLGPVIERRGREEVRIVPDEVLIDAAELERAVRAGDWRKAVEL